MRTKFFKIAGLAVLVLCVASLGVVAYAEDEGGTTHKGWIKGRKTGWQGESTPPGFAKREGRKAGRNMKETTDEAGEIAKEAREKADLEAGKTQSGADKEMKRAQKKADKETRKARKKAEKEARKKQKEAGKAAKATRTAAGAL
ncbi:MAG TPA: hypothetical protein PLH16_03380 [Candidatus Omnitrophota bacterium]|nr:hypothetical protein [Candidatus Omnitrophota bacterium]